MSKRTTNCFDEDIFFHILANHLYEHPEWMEKVITVASDTVLQKIKDERNTSVNVQFAFSMLYDKPYKKLSRENKVKVTKALLECDVFEGTPFSKQLQKQLEDV